MSTAASALIAQILNPQGVVVGSSDAQARKTPASEPSNVLIARILNPGPAAPVLASTSQDTEIPLLAVA